MGVNKVDIRQRNERKADMKQNNSLATDVITELKEQLQGELKALQAIEKRAQELVLLLQAEQEFLKDFLREDTESDDREFES